MITTMCELHEETEKLLIIILISEFLMPAEDSYRPQTLTAASC
ncbi:hypothetical protein C804_06244 [Lachnospiraceae bacterium A4]|nr:hypothetical protein C804_06244 [Lachnospiraceae bacterium A4]